MVEDAGEFLLTDTLKIGFVWHDCKEIASIEDILVAIALETLKKCEVQNGNASLVLTDDNTIRNLNKIHRGLDEITDVLSFSNKFHGEYYGQEANLKSMSSMDAFILPPGEPDHIGEVVVCLPQAKRQSKLESNGIRLELSKLVAHGFLHLLGYDHVESQERELMEQLEADILGKVGQNV